MSVLFYIALGSPLFLDFLLLVIPFKNKLTWALMALWVLLVTLFVTQTPLNSWTSNIWYFVFWLSFILSFAASGWRHRQKPFWPQKKILSWVVAASLSFAVASNLVSIPDLFTGKSFDTSKGIQLQFPLKGGTFLIIHGGANTTVNYHYAYEAQKYALDIAQVNEQGKKAKAFLSQANEDYFIFGTDVVAPCDGEVLFTQDGLENKEALTFPSEPKNPAGNHIVIFCKEASITLAHLQAKSLLVKVGDLVKSGQTLAKAGNSGNTSEPHLHVHAVRGRTTDPKVLMSTGEAVPVIYNNTFPIRGETITQ